MLKVQALMSGYGKVQVIRGVDIEIKEGEIVSIIGRNGVGKTTLMKTIIGSIRPMGGSIQINGKDFTKKQVYTRAAEGVGYVEQGHGIFPALTLEENLKIGLGINNRKKSGDLSVAHDFFPILFSRGKQKAGTLSGGEQAMLSIARVLVANPKLILLDEPSEGVQPNIVNQIGEIICKINEEMNITILMVEQHLKLIQKISQRAYAMDKGRIVGSLKREELLDQDKVTSYLTV